MIIGVTDKAASTKIIPSMICYKKKEWLYDSGSKNNMIQYAESIILKIKRSFSLKSNNNKNVQKDIKDWQVKIIENPKTKKLQYVLKK